MNIAERLFVVFLTLFLSDAVFSSVQDYTFKQIKIEDGLSQSTVFTSLQDDIGFMWFGTSSGLNKYDGYNFTVYLNDQKDSSSLAGEVIVSLFQDSQKKLWIGTIEGNINKYNRSDDSFQSRNIIAYLQDKVETEVDYYEYPLSFSRNHNFTITSITEDHQGYIWLATWGNGIFVIDSLFNKVHHFYHSSTAKSTIPTNRITKLISDPDGAIWIGTFGGGLSKCTRAVDGNYHFLNYSFSASDKNKLSDDKIITLLLDSKSNLWIGTYYGGLNLLTKSEKNKIPSEAEFKRFKPSGNANSLSNKTVMTLCEDNLGQIWIGTFGSGLDKYNPQNETFLNFTHNPSNQNSLADNDVLSLSVERSGIIWAGSHLGAGITKIQRSRAKFNLYSHVADKNMSLSDNVIWAVHEDSDDVLWVGTYRGGVNRIDRLKNEITYIHRNSVAKKSLSSNHIRAITEDNFGNLWVGTYNNGINLIDKKTLEVKRIFNSTNSNLSTNQVQSILIIGDQYWIGTFGGGLNYFQSSLNPALEEINFTQFTSDTSSEYSLTDNRVYKIFRDSKGIIWVGTFGGGLNKLDLSSGKFQHYRHNPDDENSIGDDKVISIAEDSKGYLWVGTYGGGLNRFDISTNKFERYSKKDGLASAVIYGILEDNNGNLWLSTDNGIFQFNIENKIFIRYDIIDGLQSREFSGGSYFKSKSGELFFGGINGLNYFFPDSIRSSSYQPPVVVTSVSILNEKVRGNPSELILDYNNNFITFEFASMDFSNPKDNQYSFILEGFDRSWQQTGAERRIANYTNLPPGDYIFKVRGSNSDGIWSNMEATISLIIHPPFWQIWWFILLAIISAASLVYYVSTLRIKNLLAIEKLKTKLAADLHDNVGSGLTEISILSELASFKANSNSSGSQQELKIISDLSRQLVDNMSDIVWVVNPKRDSLHDLIVRLKNSYGETLNSLGISFRVSNLENLKEIKLPIDFKQNLYLILKEAINNAIKHSKCSTIQLDANTRKDFIEVSVSDDGIGMDENKIDSGNGMKNIKHRAEAIGGRVKWKSEPNRGTSVRFVGKKSGLIKVKTFFKNN